MGYIKHDAVIATGSDYGDFKVAMSALKESWGEDGEIILGPYRGINGETTFFMAPDGSKEGWADSDRFDLRREEFVKTARDSGADVVEIRFGGDDTSTRVRATQRYSEPVELSGGGD